MSQSTKKSDTNFLMQGSILAVASIISRIVGLIYRMPLKGIIGKVGNNYYGTAFEIYNIILIISSYSIPLAVSKLVATRVSKGEYKNVHKILKGSLLFAAVSGGSASLIVYFGADIFTNMLRTPMASIALRVLAPVIFLVAIVGVFRGFFQGLNTMMPTAFSQIAEQIINAVVSIIAAYFLFSYGAKVGKVLGDSDDYAAAYGAAGGTLGTLMGSVTALLFVLFIYSLYKRILKRKMRHDHVSVDVSYGTVMWILVSTIIPVLLSTTLYNISSIIDQGIFKNLVYWQGYDHHLVSEWWGVYTGQYRVIINVPISIAGAMASSSVPSLTKAYQTGDGELVKKRIHSATRFIMLIAFPCTVGIAVLAGPIQRLLFHDADPVSAYMLIVGAISVLFYSLSTLSNGLLQGIDKLKLPVRNAAISLVLQAIFLVVMIVGFRLHIYAVVLANAFYALLMCVLNGWGIHKYSGTKQDVKKTYLLPGISSVLMGAIVFGVYYLIETTLGSNAVGTAVSIFAGMFSYFIIMLLVKGVTREELLRFPKGSLLVRFAEKLHLLPAEQEE
ncbi:MAG: polysaccharide biosynthesis protein [Lachnospiraceae bacterium]|nr:polysaccharide biosynthesis protein [Lachnospiraceae bacterium]